VVARLAELLLGEPKTLFNQVWLSSAEAGAEPMSMSAATTAKAATARPATRWMDICMAWVPRIGRQVYPAGSDEAGYADRTAPHCWGRGGILSPGGGNNFRDMVN
jgi:hypothetical protein